MKGCPKQYAIVPGFLAATFLTVLPYTLVSAAPKAQPSTPAKLTATSCGEFGFDLYRQIVGSLSQFRSPSDGNLAFSPLCLVLSLEALRQGASGQAADEIAKALHTADDIPNAGELITPLKLTTTKTQPEKALGIANGIWADKQYPLKPDFVKAATAVSDAQVANVDLASGGALSSINDWIADATGKRISQTFTPEDLSKASLAVANSIAFKADWKDGFDPIQTHPAPFHLTSGKTVQVPVMHQTATYGFADLGWVKVVELPYDGGTMAMDILLPAPKPGALSKVERSVTELWFHDLTNHFSQRKLAVAIPKFTVNCDLGDTIAMLRAQGIHRVFDPSLVATSSELSGFASKPLVPNVWKHKAWVSVDEKGTTALAAVAESPGFANGGLKPAAFEADHPFLFIIRHIPTGTPIFMGRISKP